MNTVFGPALQYLRVSFTARYARARSEESERGASAVEWVIISAIVVAIVVAVGFWLLTTLEAKGQQVCDQINGTGKGAAPGAACAGVGPGN
ncbi:hypothetical protein [Actinospica robiniae]|uniref:hypothetical protein n=1 Tax=Actinospica robiniae TaxID=304901 RepID=UPI00042525E7|nr:hypothetical protein [Actinospica robiniae]